MQPQEVKTPLPQLIKGQSTYKLIVPENVEEKIRYLIRKFPHTEWSGILFYNHTGGFETNDLVITCQDIFPMDLGTSGWTEFKMTPDVSSYIAQNIELFDCDMGLCHSHHTMGAFFSGQDTSTLQAEGNETNCFVSLIVDTRGTYVAAVTRKMKKEYEVITKSLGTSYEFFGDGKITTENSTSEQIQVISKDIIEYFMLDVERHEVSNPLDYLDERFEAIEADKKAAKPVIPTSKIEYPKVNSYNILDDWDSEYTFRSYLDEQKKEKKKWGEKEPTLWDEKEMKEMEKQEWPDFTTEDIKLAVSQMVTCSFILGDKFNLDTWIKHHLENHYAKIFRTEEAFDNWIAFIVEFQLTNLAKKINTEEFGPIAAAMQEELAPYADLTPYIAEYCKELDLYI